MARTKEEINQEARELLATRTLAELIDEWELTDLAIENRTNDPSIYTVRGWLMDELEARDPEAFNKWIDTDFESEQETSPRNFF